MSAFATSTVSAVVEIPNPVPTLKATVPLVPPPVNPSPAVTPSMSPASFVNEKIPVELL